MIEAIQKMTWNDNVRLILCSPTNSKNAWHTAKNMQRPCQVLPYSFGMSESRVGEQVRLSVRVISNHFGKGRCANLHCCVGVGPAGHFNVWFFVNRRMCGVGLNMASILEMPVILTGGTVFAIFPCYLGPNPGVHAIRGQD